MHNYTAIKEVAEEIRKVNATLQWIGQVLENMNNSINSLNESLQYDENCITIVQSEVDQYEEYVAKIHRRGSTTTI